MAGIDISSALQYRFAREKITQSMIYLERIRVIWRNAFAYSWLIRYITVHFVFVNLFFIPSLQILGLAFWLRVPFMIACCIFQYEFVHFNFHFKRNFLQITTLLYCSKARIRKKGNQNGEWRNIQNELHTLKPLIDVAKASNSKRLRRAGWRLLGNLTGNLWILIWLKLFEYMSLIKIIVPLGKSSPSKIFKISRKSKLSKKKKKKMGRKCNKNGCWEIS